MSVVLKSYRFFTERLVHYSPAVLYTNKKKKIWNFKRFIWFLVILTLFCINKHPLLYQKLIVCPFSSARQPCVVSISQRQPPPFSFLKGVGINEKLFEILTNLSPFFVMKYLEWKKAKRKKKVNKPYRIAKKNKTKQKNAM